ncbi:MAG TPA: arginyltransferase [Gemmataceae bacterium]|nr:arginyltransferase [Gemmataceae bacterium]
MAGGNSINGLLPINRESLEKMESLFHFVTPPNQCGYLPHELASMEYEQVAQLEPREYLDRLEKGWRRFGGMMFRPRCLACNQCRSLRVLVDRFRPNRSQRRNRQRNEGEITLEVGRPSVTEEKLRLYDRFHSYQTVVKNWPDHPAKDVGSYFDSFIDNPYPIEEWRYLIDDRLAGIAYVDPLPRGLSAIYFFYEPSQRHRGLGTWNVLSMIERAAALGIPFVYLGFYVADCASLAYKARFRPHERLDPDGIWREPVD